MEPDFLQVIKDVGMPFDKNDGTIILFLQVCTQKGWDLDVDEIEHVLIGDFRYIIDANTIAKGYEDLTMEEFLQKLKKEMKH